MSVQIIFIRDQLFANPRAFQAPLSMDFSRPEYQSRQSFSYSGDLPNPGIGPRPPALQADSLLSEPSGKPWKQHQYSFLLTNLHLGPFCVGHSPLLHSETAGAAGRSGQGVMCRIVHSHLAREGERMLTALSWHNRGCCASFPLSAWLLHMVSLAWWLQRSQSSYKSVLDSRGIRKKSKPSKSCIAFYNLNSHVSFPL